MPRPPSSRCRRSTQALTDVPGSGSSALLVTSIANALGIRFDGMIVLDNTHLEVARTAGRCASTSFVRSRSTTAQERSPSHPGSATISAAGTTRALIGPAVGSSLEHLVAAQAVLQGWFARLRLSSVARATKRVTGASGTLVALGHAVVNFRHASRRRAEYRHCDPVRAQEPGRPAPAGRLFPGAMITSGKRRRVQASPTEPGPSPSPGRGPTGGSGRWRDHAHQCSGFGVRHTSVVYSRSKRAVALSGCASTFPALTSSMFIYGMANAQSTTSIRAWRGCG